MLALPKFRTFRSSVIFSAVVGAVLAQRHFGMGLVLVLLILAPWVVVSAATAYGRPEQRSILVARICIWVVMCALVVGWHFYLHQTTRTKAQEIVDKVLAFQRSTGAFPENLLMVGITDEERKQLLGLSFYRREERDATLVYASTYMTFETEQYSFSTRRWAHVYD